MIVMRLMAISGGAIFVLGSIIFGIWFLRDYGPVLLYYQAGQCTILEKQILQRQQYNTTDANSPAKLITVYKPDFQFTVHTASGHEYPARGYDSTDQYLWNQSSAQTIIDQYRVGKTYPCRYDPANPSQVALAEPLYWQILCGTIGKVAKMHQVCRPLAAALLLCWSLLF
jgi:hypothetical protein